MKAQKVSVDVAFLRYSSRNSGIASRSDVLEIAAMSESAVDYRKLSIPERIQLVEDIWDSIAEDTGAVAVPPAVLEEAERRLTEHKQDPGSAIPGDQVRAEMYDRGE